jgi:hypothetical protein
MAGCRATFHVEISDHDGYCSGNESEYRTYDIERDVEDADDVERQVAAIERDVEASLNHEGSGYCDVSLESAKHGLGQHDYLVTVIAEPIVKAARVTR